MTGSPDIDALCAPAIAYQGNENEVMNWNRPSRKSWAPV